jgi:hypothetical protein
MITLFRVNLDCPLHPCYIQICQVLLLHLVLNKSSLAQELCMFIGKIDLYEWHVLTTANCYITETKFYKNRSTG